MPAEGTKRGDEDRKLHPLLERALRRLDEKIGRNQGQVSQSQVARESGIPQGQISKIVNGKVPEVSFFVLAKIALAADVSLDFLVQEPPAPKTFAAESDTSERPSKQPDPPFVRQKTAARK